MKFKQIILFLLPSFFLVACQPSGDSSDENSIVTDSGLKVTFLEEGSGDQPQPGDLVSVHYAGTLEDGTEFDSSYGGDPIAFPLGQGYVIPGWDEGIALMQAGSKAQLTIPPELAYGEQGFAGVIPPNATLYFDMELVEILPGAPDEYTQIDDADFQTTATGLRYYDLAIGDGAEAAAGNSVAVHYTGWLVDGSKFDSSLDRGQPFVFTLGQRDVISGWDEGVAGMKAGGQRQLVIPPDLGYGSGGAGAAIPPNATLIFEVELVEILQ